jgi:hypothetical protein
MHIQNVPLSKRPTLKTFHSQNVPSLNVPCTKRPTAQNFPLSKRPTLKTSHALNVPRHKTSQKTSHGTKRPVALNVKKRPVALNVPNIVLAFASRDS